MDWSDQRTRIRRFLRDPDGNIWSNAFLLRLFNAEQQALTQETGTLEGVETIRVPPRFEDSYMHDWEYGELSGTGKPYQCLQTDQQSGDVYCHRWESGVYFDASTSSEGDAITHPWEAWYANNPGPVPIWFPPDFYKAKLVAWDLEPISFLSLKEISSTDPTWVTRAGKPFAYTRLDEFSNEFALYPRPDTPVWDDISGTGPAIYNDGDTLADSSSEGGTITGRSGTLFNSDPGITVDIVVADDNVLVVYQANPEDIQGDDDTSAYPRFLQKYLEYGVIAQGYRANTDGRIGSLADYWDWRRNLGIGMIKRFSRKRKTDRDYRLVTRGVQPRRNLKHARLPDAYPAI